AVPLVSLPDGDEVLGWCDKIIDTSKRTGMRYMLGETSYYRANAMFCRQKAEQGLFGDFVYAEGEYFHDLDQPKCSLRKVQKNLTSSQSGKEWLEKAKEYKARGMQNGPMFYPTHSVSGPACVMNAHALKVTSYGYRNQNNDPYFTDHAFSNETALFEMSNGSTVRICEFRECAGSLGKEDETFRIMGTKGSYSEKQWTCNHRDSAPAEKDKYETVALTQEDMRDPLPQEVRDAFAECSKEQSNDAGDFVPSGHGGSHPYLVHEFVDAIYHNRQPAINAWESARYMAMGVMAHKSALLDGERLDVPDWGDAPE
ncbi:MAG: hypothetical protein KAI74_02840, partial [Kiritimatiellae bacterium]|nr:hypothetical protein [Kiritimatiellia bacterium]